jgi:small subunit ribosomal protein S6
MTLPAPTYDLTLLLDPDAEEAARAKIVADARAAIEARGELARLDEWGTRPLSYPIEHKNAAEYYLLQFHAATPELLADLQRSLRITDGILRFRIVKLKPGVPAAPDMRVASSSPSRTEAPPTGPPAEVDIVEIDAVIEVDGVGAGESDGQPEPPAAGEPAPGDEAAAPPPPQPPKPPDAPAQVEAAGEPQAGDEPAAPGGET